MLSTQTFFPKLFQTSQLCQTTTALQTPAPQRLVFTDETIISLSPQQQLWNSTYKLKTGSSITRRAPRIEDQPEQTLLSFSALQPAHPGLCHTQLSSARLPGACFCSASPGHQGRAIQGCSAGPGLWLLLGPHACTWLCPSRAFPAPALELIGSLTKAKHNFQEVPWAWRVRRAWKVQEWVARWEWEGNKRTRGDASPGAAWLMGSLSCIPKKPIQPWARSESQGIWQLHWGALDTGLQEDLTFLYSPWLWFNHGLWCFKYQILIKSGSRSQRDHTPDLLTIPSLTYFKLLLRNIIYALGRLTFIRPN